MISHPEGVERVVIDAGALALSKDAGPCSVDALMSLGTVCAALAAAEPEPGLRLASLSQEHGVIRPVHVGGLDGRLPVGTRLRVLPNHSCLTTACHDEVHVVDDGRVTDCWQIHRRR